MKKRIQETIYTKMYNNEQAEIRFSDLPKDIEENDIIHIHREEAHNSIDNSYDAYTELIVLRERDETDEEYRERMLELEKYREELKKMRYKNYLKLKSEFEAQD
jgi:hypothetical protein